MHCFLWLWIAINPNTLATIVGSKVVLLSASHLSTGEHKVVLLSTGEHKFVVLSAEEHKVVVLSAGGHKLVVLSASQHKLRSHVCQQKHTRINPMLFIPTKHTTFVQHLHNVGPTSQTLGLRCKNVIQMICVCRVIINKT